ncbi:hypothetical protein E2C01_072730 [Portunus trituberculatus]|uniref:Uncharacterized protein n=1 Tax=Portunus trituberculatus TaxID=210409 RepID=A0A5B7I7Y1_PORTR|nr:hypothetical protein [Portunus trituberculatus]
MLRLRLAVPDVSKEFYLDQLLHVLPDKCNTLTLRHSMTHSSSASVHSRHYTTLLNEVMTEHVQMAVWVNGSRNDWIKV